MFCLDCLSICSMSRLLLLSENIVSVLSDCLSMCSLSRLFLSLENIVSVLSDCLSICSIPRLFLSEYAVSVLPRLSFNMFHVKVISFAGKYCKCIV